MTGRYNQSYNFSVDSERKEPRAKRSLGQNFLHDANIARKIVRLLHIASGDAVLEIGPGPGSLTEHLLAGAPARLVLVEKDPYWALERMRRGEGALSVIVADALALPWERFSAPWKIIGNLPYNVASPLMWEVFSRATGLTRAVFMVQKEVGQRLVARPGTSAYGALSVWVQSFVRPKLECVVSPQVFRPRPKVDSAVLSFVPVRDGGDFVPEALARTLKACFQMRRKQMGTIVRSFGGAPEALFACGVDPTLRPENLPPATFHRLADAGIF